MARRFISEPPRHVGDTGASTRPDNASARIEVEAYRVVVESHECRESAAMLPVHRGATNPIGIVWCSWAKYCAREYL